ncbi:hypothetical protein ABMY26_22360 [Azospirillum sp. HJ39]|uniref:hypothetical protein n=1 Tax=Azospirillum sp. HJ39 TaxID=3159496 RepID=UPI003555E98E
MKFSMLIAGLLCGILSFGAGHAGAEEVRIGKNGYETNLTTSQTATIVSANQNTGGINIKSLQFWASGGLSLSLVATYPNSSKVTPFYVTSFPSNPVNAAMPYPINLPAGVSLSVVSSTDSGAGGVRMGYDLVN